MALLTSFVGAQSKKPPACGNVGWSLVYQNDIDGTTLVGSKADLFDAVRKGDPIRLAWGSILPDDPQGSVEHAAEPVFITITSNKELFAQLPEHVLLASYSDPNKVRFADKVSVMWCGMLGTDGSFDAIVFDRVTGNRLAHIPQRARVAWFTIGPSKNCDRRRPLRLSVPSGVIHEKKTK